MVLLSHLLVPKMIVSLSYQLGDLFVGSTISLCLPSVYLECLFLSNISLYLYIEIYTSLLRLVPRGQRPSKNIAAWRLGRTFMREVDYNMQMGHFWQRNFVQG